MAKTGMPSAAGRMEGATRRRAASIADTPSAIREFWIALRNWASVIALLLVQYVDRRSRAGRLGFLLMLAEPFILILALYFIRAVFRGLVTHYGESLLLFLVSGMLPYYLCMRTLVQVRKSQIKTGRSLPRITSMDIFIADIIGNALVWLLTMVVMFGGLYFWGIDQARPKAIDQCLIALFLLVAFGAGFGLMNSAISRFFPPWLIIVGFSMRGLVFFSGVFHIADLYRPTLRQWVAWNPILHGIDWFRLGLYGDYPVRLMDEAYLVKCALIFLFIGIVVDRATLRRGSQ